MITIEGIVGAEGHFGTECHFGVGGLDDPLYHDTFINVLGYLTRYELTQLASVSRYCCEKTRAYCAQLKTEFPGMVPPESCIWLCMLINAGNYYGVDSHIKNHPLDCRYSIRIAYISIDEIYHWVGDNVEDPTFATDYIKPGDNIMAKILAKHNAAFSSELIKDLLIRSEFDIIGLLPVHHGGTIAYHLMRALKKDKISLAQDVYLAASCELWTEIVRTHDWEFFTVKIARKGCHDAVGWLFDRGIAQVSNIVAGYLNGYWREHAIMYAENLPSNNVIVKYHTNRHLLCDM